MVKIEGINEAMRAFQNAPKNMEKVMKTAVKDACKPVAREIRTKTPTRFRKLVKTKVSLNRSNNIEAWIGLFNNKQKRGHQGKKKVDDWFKAYWLNYGTLENRNPHHKYQNAIKHSRTAAARNRKGRRGIKPRNFYPFEDGLTSEMASKVIRELETSLKKQQDKLL